MKLFCTSFLFIFCCFLSAQIQIGGDIDGETDFDEFGTSVSVSSNGNIMAVGSPYHGGKGYVRVFENQSDSWIQIGNDIEGESTGDKFGISVSLSNDGTILAVGADANDGASGNNNGSVRVFEYNGVDTWNQIGGDIDGEADGDGSGFRVSLSSDGTIVAISAKGNDGNGNLSGHVRVYQNQSNIWTKLGNDIDGENAGDQFGESLDISSDGSIIAVGSINNGLSGHVQVFEYNGVDTWNQIGSDIDGKTTGEESGTSISLSSDGSIIAIGAPKEPFPSQGNVRIYENQSNIWEQIGSDIIGGDLYGLGESISLSSNGRIVAIGGTQQNGRALVYTNLLGTWTQLGSTISGDASGDSFGGAVDLSSDGTKLAVSAKTGGSTGTNRGLARAYDYSATLSNIEFNFNSSLLLIPNPAKDRFSIVLNKNTKLKSINLYDGIGKIVKTFNKTNVDVSNLSNGLYYVEVETNIGKTIEKLIIQ